MPMSKVLQQIRNENYQVFFLRLNGSNSPNLRERSPVRSICKRKYASTDLRYMPTCHRSNMDMGKGIMEEPAFKSSHDDGSVAQVFLLANSSSIYSIYICHGAHAAG